MRIIHLARKPLEESSVTANILKHGTGALHIDAGRIASNGDHMVHGTVTRQTVVAGDDRSGRALGMNAAGSSFTPTNHAGGRWPPNVVLQHFEGCRCLGTQRVKATSIHGESSAVRRSGVHSEAGGHQTVGRVQRVSGYADTDGMESVEVWDCVPDCPVADLDVQTVAKASRFYKQVEPG